MQVDSQLFPIVPNDRDNNVILRHVAVVFSSESRDTLVELLKIVPSVLLDPSGVHEALWVVHDLVGAVFLLGENGDNVGESRVRVSVVGAHVIDLLRVEPSLCVGDIGFVGEEVNTDRNGFRARGRYGLQRH